MNLPHSPGPGQAEPAIPDDPSSPCDPTWEELGQNLREAGLTWEDLGHWELGPTPESLDLTPMFLVGMQTVTIVEGGAR